MNRWYGVPEEDKAIAYRQIAERVNLPAYAVEKDWWVVLVLSILFGMKTSKPGLITKQDMEATVMEFIDG